MDYSTFRAMRLALLLCGLLSASALAGSPYPQQVKRWEDAKVNPKYSIQLDQIVALYQRKHAIYEAIEHMRQNGVPAPVLVGLHYRESDNSFTCHPHEGSPLTHKTRYVPKGRPPGDPPFTFLESAEDAYYSYEHLDRWNWHDLGTVLQAAMLFNGSGYSKRGVPSPYLWSGTNQYSKGKYVSDGRYDPNFVDKQMGVAAILIRLKERGVKLQFSN